MNQSTQSLQKSPLPDAGRTGLTCPTRTQRFLFSCPRMICPRKARKNTEGRTVFFSCLPCFPWTLSSLFVSAFVVLPKKDAVAPNSQYWSKLGTRLTVSATSMAKYPYLG
ncbi:MAG: hypothetical protein [Olavius algarvensis Gamma 1 endosymbiont]|nr:MAG: hypothetical protein [Olavius algarvensis Gamma 1 endosymbiont]